VTPPSGRLAPPRLSRGLLARALPQNNRHFILDDLDEAFAARVRDRGVVHARRWYRWQVLRGLMSALALRQSSVLSGVWLDVRHGVRALRRSPGFSAVAILVLGLGIGVNTAAFTVVNALFFKPLPVKAPEELVYVYQTQPKYGQVAVTSFRDVEYLEQHSAVLAEVGAHWGRSVLFAADGETETLRGEHVSANYFDLLGIQAPLGRTFVPEDGELSSTEPAVVISDEWWRHRFKSDRSIVGKRVRLDNKEFTVVGVAPSGFVGLSDPWKPSRYWVTSAQFSGVDYVRFGVGVFGRIRPGLTFEQARSGLVGEFRPKDDAENERLRASGWGAKQRIILPVSDVRTPYDPRAEVVPARLVSAVTMVVAIVFLIAVANIAGVLMARGVARAPELAARRALGASAGRLVRQLLTESVLVSLLGGLAGLIVAWLLMGFYRAYTPDRYVVDITLDMRVMLFAVATCVAAGMLIGLAPAWQARSVDILSSLGRGAGAGTTKRTRRRFRYGIVIPQVGLALALLVVAGVHVRTLRAIEHDDLGYAVDDRIRISAGYWSPDQPGELLSHHPEDAAKRAERSREFYRKVFDSVRNVPGADGVAITDRLPVYSATTPPTWLSEDQYLSGTSDVAPAGLASVSPGYFRTMGMHLVRGRDFDDRDVLNSVHTAVVSEGFAQRMWPGRDPIGQRLAAYSPDNPDKKLEWLEVTGLVNEVDPILHDRGESPFVYVALGQRWQPGYLSVVGWGHGDQAALVQSIKRAVIGADTFAQVSDVRTLKQIVGEILYPRRTAAGILVVCGFVGLLLASIGLYGVVSYSVAQRTREIGVRIALGADRRLIAGLVLREAAAVTGIGALLGFGLSAFALRATATLVGPVPTSDALVFLLVPAVVGAVVLLGCYVPARRAATADPVEALRTS
jgi:putative ABC transport system permease protein